MAPGDPGAAVEVRPSAPPARHHPMAPIGAALGEDQPLTDRQLVFLDDVIYEAELMTGLRYATYLGDLGPDTTATARDLHARLGADAPWGVLLAVSPAQRVAEVVTGSEAGRRITDRAARLAILGVVAACGAGDLVGALTNGIRTLADQAGILPDRSNW